MTHFDYSSADRALDGTAAPVAGTPGFAMAATPEQAAALYDEQVRKAAAIEAALAALDGNVAALPTMSVRSLDEITRGGDWKLARSRVEPAEPSGG
jgi:hypothetical protein